MLRNPTRLLASEATHLKSTINGNRVLRRLIAVIGLATALLLTGIGILDKTNDASYEEHWVEVENNPSMRLFIGVF